MEYKVGIDVLTMAFLKDGRICVGVLLSDDTLCTLTMILTGTGHQPSFFKDEAEDEPSPQLAQVGRESEIFL